MKNQELSDNKESLPTKQNCHPILFILSIIYWLQTNLMKLVWSFFNSSCCCINSNQTKVGVSACFGRVKNVKQKRKEENENEKEKKMEQKGSFFHHFQLAYLPQLKLVNLLTRHGDKAKYYQRMKRKRKIENKGKSRKKIIL